MLLLPQLNSLLNEHISRAELDQVVTQLERRGIEISKSTMSFDDRTGAVLVNLSMKEPSEAESQIIVKMFSQFGRIKISKKQVRIFPTRTSISFPEEDKVAAVFTPFEKRKFLVVDSVFEKLNGKVFPGYVLNKTVAIASLEVGQKKKLTVSQSAKEQKTNISFDIPTTIGTPTGRRAAPRATIQRVDDSSKYDFFGKSEKGDLFLTDAAKNVFHNDAKVQEFIQNLKRSARAEFSDLKFKIYVNDTHCIGQYIFNVQYDKTKKLDLYSLHSDRNFALARKSNKILTEPTSDDLKKINNYVVEQLQSWINKSGIKATFKFSKYNSPLVLLHGAFSLTDI